MNESVLNNQPAPVPTRAERPWGLAESSCFQCNGIHFLEDLERRFAMIILDFVRARLER